MKFELPVPCGENFAIIPYPMSQEDFDLLLATLNLWKPKIVPGAKRAPAPVMAPRVGDEPFCPKCKFVLEDCDCPKTNGLPIRTEAQQEKWLNAPIKRGGLLAEVKAVLPRLPEVFSLSDACALLPDMPRVKVRCVILAIVYSGELKQETVGTRGRFGVSPTYRKLNSHEAPASPADNPAAVARLKDLQEKRAFLQNQHDHLDENNSSRILLKQRVAEFDEMIAKWEVKISEAQP